MSNRQSPYRIAAHESAHAVAAHAQGIPICEVQLDPPRCVVAVPNLEQVMYNPLERDMVAPSVRVALAGLVADAIMGADQEQGYSEALAESKDLLLAAEQVGALELHVDEFIDSSALYLERLAAQARDLVTKHWGSIALVAAELQRYRSLSGAEVALIVKTGQPLSRPPARPTYEEWRAMFSEMSARAAKTMHSAPDHVE